MPGLPGGFLRADPQAPQVSARLPVLRTSPWQRRQQFCGQAVSCCPVPSAFTSQLLPGGINGDLPPLPPFCRFWKRAGFVPVYLRQTPVSEAWGRGGLGLCLQLAQSLCLPRCYCDWQMAVLFQRQTATEWLLHDAWQVWGTLGLVLHFNVAEAHVIVDSVLQAGGSLSVRQN